MGLSSSLASSGGDKIGTLYLDLESDQSSGSYYTISDDDLLQRFDEIAGTDPEKIVQIKVYATPLHSWQATLGIMYHAYVVLETDKWFYSLEKTDKNIAMQRSKYLSHVRDMRERERRNTEVVSDRPRCLERAHGKGTVRDVMKYLYRKDLLHKEYCLFNANCKHLAKIIFDKFNSQEKTYDFFEWPCASVRRDGKISFRLHSITTRSL